MSEEAKKDFKQNIINKTVRIKTKNNRVFEGTLKAVDFRSNLIIHNAVAQIPDDQNCPLNAELNNLYDVRLVFPENEKMTEEEKKIAKEKYLANHYYIGPIMISGEDIIKVEIKNQEKKVEIKA